MNDVLTAFPAGSLYGARYVCARADVARARLALPAASPWRYVMIGATPAQLLERNYVVLNLNDPPALADVSWIKPGKVIRDVTLTTQGGLACVDFAAARGLQYVDFYA